MLQFEVLKSVAKCFFLLFLMLQGLRIVAQPACVDCCCGNAIEVGVPGGNFEDPPYSNPIIVYFAGEMYSTWSILSGSIDVLGPNYSNWATGNPNGASQFIDLHGNTPGSFATTLTGLNLGYEYFIVLWYAKNEGASSANCQIEVAGGAWLNQTWTATNNGSSGWLQKCYSFTAQATSAELKFTGSGPTTAGGVLLDDITMYSCPPKSTPIFTDPPDDITDLQCVKDVPPVPVLVIEDDCDNNPVVTFTSSTTGPACNQTIKRTWVVSNSCGNTAKTEQNIFIEDTEAPIFTKDPEDLVVDCSADILGEFTAWLDINGGATANDNCEGALSWIKDYDMEPEFPCSETVVTFIAEDNCGNQESRMASFIVEDLESPKIVTPPVNVVLVCSINPYDSLITWVNQNAYAVATDNCGIIKWTNDFNGDLTKTDYTVNFTATDECNNSTTYPANFLIQFGGTTNFLTKTSCDLAQVGINTATFQINGCDSIVITETKFSLSDTTFISGTSCKFADAVFDTILLKNQIGCDSLIIRNIAFIKPDTTILENKSCSIMSFSIDTSIYQGQFCDSVVLVKNIPLLSSTTLLKYNTCDFTKAGTFVLNLQNQFGCDSIVTSVISYAGFTFSNQTIQDCGKFPNYIDTLSFVTPECDSFVFVQYIFHDSDTTILTQGTCDISQIGNDTVFLNNQWGCDSLIITGKFLLPSDSTFAAKNTCNQNEAGIFVTQLFNQYGCDSIIIQQVNFIESDSLFIELTTCDPSMAGVYVQNFSTAFCDSVVVTTKILANPTESKKSIFSCLIAVPKIDTLVLTNKAGCDSLVILETIPKQLDGFISTSNVLCKGLGNGTIEIDSILNGNAPYFYSLNDIDYYPGSKITNLMPGNFTLYIKDLAGCKAVIENVGIQDGESFTIGLGTDKTIFEGSELSLTPVYSSTPFNIVWSPENLFSCSSCPDAKIILTGDQKIFLYAENQNGCPAIDSLLIKVRPDIKVYIPNVFSPDLNGINDYFTIYGNYHLINIKELNVYSRWGEQVFHGEDLVPNNPSLGWNGKFRGELMGQAVFVFWALLEFDDGTTELYKGEVSIIR